MTKTILILGMLALLADARAQEEATAPAEAPAVTAPAPTAAEAAPKEEKAEAPVAKVDEAPVPVPAKVTPPAPAKAPLKVETATVPAKAPPVPLMPNLEPDLAEQGIPGNPLPAPTAVAPVMRERLELLGNSPTAEPPVDAEIAIILHNSRFYPSRIKLKEGQPTRLFFTSLNQKPAALIVEELRVQRWIAKETGSAPQAPAGEISRELSQNRITEISLQPKRGTYMFHDALSGAVGEILVE